MKEKKPIQANIKIISPKLAPICPASLLLVGVGVLVVTATVPLPVVVVLGTGMGSNGAGVPLVSTESDVLLVVAGCKGAGVPLVSVESDVTGCRGGTLVTVLETEV